MLAVEPQIIATYVQAGQVQLVFRPVLNHGARSLRTSEAAVCALQQERFWAMHELLFLRLDAVWATGEGQLRPLMSSYAAELGLDMPAFEACMDSGEALAQVQAWDAEQRQRGIVSQPTFTINDQRLVGLQPFPVFQQVIDSMLAAP